MASPFLWSGNTGQIRTPEQAAEARSVASALAGSRGRVATNGWEGLAQVANALSERAWRDEAENAEAAGRERAGALFADLAVNQDPNSIIAALTSPDAAWASPAQTSIASALLNSGLERQDPMYQAQLAKLTSPEAVDPWAQYKVINGQVVGMGPDGLQAVGDFREIEPAKAPTVQKVMLSDGSEMAVQWEPNSESWVPINAPEGGGSLRPPKGLTESQSKLTLFQTLQDETQPVLLDLEGQFDPANIGDAAARSTPIAGNFFQSEQGQIYNTAAKAWAEGALRIATGAAATPEEMTRTLSTYFAQPGDTPTTIAFKSKMRDMYSRAINNSLGKQTEGNLPLPSEFATGVAGGGARSANPLPPGVTIRRID